MQTIVGAGGVVGNALAAELVRNGAAVRLVSRRPPPGTATFESVAADAADRSQVLDAVAGSSVVYLLVGLKYDVRVWRDVWPRVMHNTIEACERTGAKLVFFDNVYAYGKVNGPMTERTPFNPTSRKGEIRAEIATALLRAIESGRLTAMIGRSADFFGPAARTSVLNLLVFDKLAQRATASWLANDSVPHSFTFVPDAVSALALLARTESAWNQTWHLPTRPQPPAGKDYVRMIASELGVAAKYRVLGRPMIRIAGMFVPEIRETYEMLYQYDSGYVFDSTKFATAFGVEATAYDVAIRQTAQTYGAGSD